MHVKRNILFDELVEVVGIAAATALSRQWGGRVLYIAHKPTPGCPLAVVVGMEAAEVMARHFGGIHLWFPITQGKHSKVRRLRAEGISISEIARQTGYTVRNVYIILGQTPPAEADTPPLLAIMGKL
ncbi:hypothetical protein [Nitrospirillum amazonense]|uniref:hypothetical protein n=1 Tax=Nitrospirillum amazonense TaxID=28077 RepID=UPI002412C7FF|nr:hypothetical protein [Nitrospirillum amazonense]MDG3442454.1 hypothetical protein [Nitrospirillum amazonense]